MDRIDHLVYAVPDLESGIRQMEQHLGVRATPGGQHPAWGTHNALIALGTDCFLEIIAPDPELPSPAGPRIFLLDELTAPRLVTWAARTSRLGYYRSRNAGLGTLLDGSRRRPDGHLLTWRLTDPAAFPGDGLIPFLIDWGTTENPARTAAAGCRLLDLRAQHPHPEHIRAILLQLDLDLTVTAGPVPQLIATIDTPKGSVELR